VKGFLPKVSTFLFVLVPVLGAAQTSANKEHSLILVLPFIGTNLEDTELLTEHLITEIETTGEYRVIQNQDGDEGAAVFSVLGQLIEEADKTIFRLFLYRLEDNSLIVSEELAYGDINDALQLMPVLVRSLLLADPSPMPGPAGRPEWLYLGIRGGGSSRVYNTGTDPGVFGLTLEGGVHVAVPFPVPRASNPRFYIELQAEGIFTMDADISNDFRYFSLMFPLLLRFNFNTGALMLAPYGGAYFALPLEMGQGMEYHFDGPLSPYGGLGWIAGIGFGFRLGPGNLFFDARFSQDIGKTIVDGGAVPPSTRNMVTLSVGYEFGLFKRKVQRW
jgi:hypothetical protein